MLVYQMSMLSREAYEPIIPSKNSGTTLPYRAQSVCWAPEQWRPNAFLSGPCTISRTLRQGHRHFLLAMWRFRHAAVTLMEANWVVDVRMSAVCEKVEDFHLRPKWGRGVNRTTRTVQELPQGMCVTTQLGHTPGKRTFSTTKENSSKDLEMCN